MVGEGGDEEDGGDGCSSGDKMDNDSTNDTNEGSLAMDIVINDAWGCELLRAKGGGRRNALSTTRSQLWLLGGRAVVNLSVLLDCLGGGR